MVWWKWERKRKNKEEVQVSGRKWLKLMAGEGFGQSHGFKGKTCGACKSAGEIHP